MKRISISEKLIFYFVTLGIVVIIIIGTYTYYFTKKALLNRTFDQLISLRMEKKNRIEQFFLDRNNDINLISKSEEIKIIISNINKSEALKNQNNKLVSNSYLSNYLSSHGYFRRLFVTNLEGRIFDINSLTEHNSYLSDNDTICSHHLKDFCQKIRKAKGTIIQDLTKTDMLIYIGTPVTDSKRNIYGFVVLEIPLSAINNIMFGQSANNGLGRTGETYLVGDDFLMRSNSRFKEDAVLNLEVKSTSVIKAFEGETGVGIARDYRNVSCLSSYSKVSIAELNWALLAEIDEQEAMISVYSIRNSILLISIIIAANVFVFAFLISKKITQPIKKLQKASEEIGTGNYNVNLKVTSLDEIGALTKTFNEMTCQLKKQKEEIENEKIKQFNSLIDGQEIERQRLSRDLHDGLGQSILAVKIKLERAKNSNAEMSQMIINETQELLKNTIQEIRHISNDLMPPVLEAFGIEHGLKNLCKETTTNAGIEVGFFSENLPPNLDRRLQIYLYRISQEAINNITKHSKATSAFIEIFYADNIIQLNIADNGKGFDTSRTEANRNGLINIKQRVELLKGRCTIQSSPEKGTQISIIIPV